MRKRIGIDALALAALAAAGPAAAAVDPAAVDAWPRAAAAGRFVEPVVLAVREARLVDRLDTVSSAPPALAPAEAAVAGFGLASVAGGCLLLGAGLRRRRDRRRA